MLILKVFCYVFCYSLFLWSANCESTTETTETLLQTFKSYINASHDLDKSDKQMLKAWGADFQVQLVNVTSHYRLEMIKYKEEFRCSGNCALDELVWKRCTNLHHREVADIETKYYEAESKCLIAASADAMKKKRAVGKVEKEIRKWRKSYKYLSNKCSFDNPDDEEAAAECLVKYVLKDNYHVTLQRLMLLKLNAMSELYDQMLTSVQDLETCLKRDLSRSNDNVRNILEVIYKCYNRIAFNVS